MSKRKIRILPLALILSFSCATHGFKVKTRESFPCYEAEALIVKVRNTGELLKTVRFESEVKLGSPRRSFSFKLMASAKKPGLINLTALKFTTPVTYLSMEKEIVTAYDAKSAEYYQGEGVASLLDKFVGIRLGFEDFMAFLFAGVNLNAPFNLDSCELINSKYVKGVFSSPESPIYEKEIWIDVANESLVFAHLRDSSLIEGITFSFFDHKKEGQFFYPRAMYIRMENPFSELSIKIGKVALNQTIDDEEFILYRPPNSKIYPLESIEGIF